MNNTPPPSITTWERLEPRPRGDSLTPALEARIYDPAWMLSQQWKLAEFRGQDAAFPVQVSFTVTSQVLSAVQPPAGNIAGPAGQYPLEASVWPEPQTGPLTGGLSAEFGAELVRLLTEQGCSQATISSIIMSYPLPEPAPGAADLQGTDYLSLLACRVPDTIQLEPLMREAAGGTVPSSLGVASGDDAPVMAAAIAWIARLDSFALSAAQPADTWQPSRLEHQFSVTVGSASGTPFSLTASSWPGQLLEWSDFDVPAQATPPAPSTLPELPGTVRGTGPPHPLTYPGAPPRRYWTLEDGNMNLAAVTVSPDDLARMLIVEFATVYGNDWYLLPIQLPSGAVHQISQLTITNSFGDPPDNLGPVAPSLPTVGSDPAGPSDWCLFRQTVLQPDGTTPNLNGLLLLPAAAAVQSSPPVEEVVLIRDDTADIGWAVEHTILGADDRPLDRYSAAAQQTPVTTPSSRRRQHRPVRARDRCPRLLLPPCRRPQRPAPARPAGGEPRRRRRTGPARSPARPAAAAPRGAAAVRPGTPSRGNYHPPTPLPHPRLRRRTPAMDRAGARHRRAVRIGAPRIRPGDRTITRITRRLMRGSVGSTATTSAVLADNKRLDATSRSRDTQEERLVRQRSAPWASRHPPARNPPKAEPARECGLRMRHETRLHRGKLRLQGRRVERPPPSVCVGGHHPRPQVVRVVLRLAVPAGALQPRTDHRTRPPARLGAVHLRACR